MKKHFLLGWVVGFAAAILTGCGSAKYSSQTNMSNSESYIAETTAAVASMMADNGAYDGMGVTESKDESSTSLVESGGELTTSNRKLIKTVSMDVETEEFDSLINNLVSRIAQTGGYVENSESRGNRSYPKSGRYASYTIRVPADQLEELIGNISELANVIWKNESVSDITLQYVDVESHKTALEIEQNRLLELMEKAETVEDIIAIESRLSEIRYQLEYYESTLRTYDNQVNYSTLYLNISEVTKLTPQEEPNAWERIRDGFVENLEHVGTGIKDFLISFVIAIPYLIVWGILLGGIWWIIRKLIRVRKGHKRKWFGNKGAKTEEKEKKEEKEEEKK